MTKLMFSCISYNLQQFFIVLALLLIICNFDKTLAKRQKLKLRSKFPNRKQQFQNEPDDISQQNFTSNNGSQLEWDITKETKKEDSGRRQKGFFKRDQQDLVDYDKYKLQGNRRNLDASPCMVFSSPNVCKQCNAGYLLFLRNATHIMCAMADGVWTDEEGKNLCYLKDEDYPFDSAFIIEYYNNYFSFMYPQPIPIDNANNYCYDPQLYFIVGPNVNEDVICDATGLEQEIDDNVLVTIILSTAITCLECADEDWPTSLVREYPQFGIYTAECSKSTTGCSYNEYYDTKLKDCIECHEKFQNCAACSETTCTLCIQNYFWNPRVYNYGTGGYSGQCVFNTCPVNFCKSKTLSKCVASTLSNCLKCEDAGDGTQTCQQCLVGYYPDDTTFLCVAITAGIKTKTFYITSQVATVKNADDSIPAYGDGSSPASPSPFIMHAYNTIMMEDYLTNESIGYIYVGKGNHFLFSCTGNEETLYKFKSLKTQIPYCTEASLNLMKKIPRLVDKVTVTLQALECSMAGALGLDPNDASFLKMCVNLSKDPKPLIYVNSAFTTFNITGMMTVKNLRFSGINAFAKSPKASQDISVFPYKLCDIKSQLLGNEKAIPIKKVLYPKAFKFLHFCDDLFAPPAENPMIYNGTFQCELNEYNQFDAIISSTIGCPGEPSNAKFFTYNLGTTKVDYYFRRRSLFNLYGFAEHTSLRNATPELYIQNCEFQHFLHNYESLINVETNALKHFTTDSNYIQEDQTVATKRKTYFAYNSGDRGAKIRVSSSSFSDSRFCKGLIVYRSAPFDQQSKALTNFTHIFMTTPRKFDQGSFIILENSNFTNLNAITSVNALAIYGGQKDYQKLKGIESVDTLYFPLFLHKGIILNVEDFGGRIEILSNTITQNMHYIPEINYNGSIFRSKELSEFKDSSVTREYQFVICDEDQKIDFYLFRQGLQQTQDMDDLYDEFERLSTIYISRNKDKIIIKDNYFAKNIGTFGGAISINSPNFAFGKDPYTLILNNEFEQNMAYFSGNAMYLRPTMKVQNISFTCGGFTIYNNEFNFNVGMKIHNGGAISINCLYLPSLLHDDYNSFSSFNRTLPNETTTYIASQADLSFKFKIHKYMINIEDNYFGNNYSGQKGTAIYLNKISSTRINNCTFLMNGPVYAIVEEFYSPYRQYLSSKAITFNHVECMDELSYLDSCLNDQNRRIYWSQVQGAIYAEFCIEKFCMGSNVVQNLEISESKFVKNQAGPVLDHTYDNDNTLASQIYILGGFHNLITDCDFFDNRGLDQFFADMQTSAFVKYFPKTYFDHSHVPMITIQMTPQSSAFLIALNTTFDNCRFKRNKNFQVVGMTESQEYSGSIVRLVNDAKSPINFLPILNLQNCEFSDNYMIGPQGTLFYVQNAIVRAIKNTFKNNGFLYTNNLQNTPTNVKLISKVFEFNAYSLVNQQENGIFTIEGDLVIPNSHYHQFVNNTFTFLFSTRGAVYSLGVNRQNTYMSGNTYKNLFTTEGGSILYGYAVSGQSNIIMENEFGSQQFNDMKGAILLVPQDKELLNLIIRNSVYQELYANEGQFIHASIAGKIVVQNVNVTQNPNQNPRKNQIIQSQFIQDFLPFSTFIEKDYFTALIVSRIQYLGYVVLNDVSNSQSIVFGKNTLYNEDYEYIDYSEFIDCQFMYNIATKSSVLSVLTSNLRLINSPKKKLYIQNNKQSNKGVISLEIDSKMIAENINIYNNLAFEKGSSMYVSQSTAYISNSTIFNNSALEVGGIQIESDSNFYCNYCNIIENKAYDTSTIFGFNNQKSTMLFNNSLFLNNTAGLNLINLLYSNIHFYNTRFLDNRADKVNHGLTLINSQATLINVTVDYTIPAFLWQNTYQVDVGFLKLDYQSQVWIVRSHFRNCRGSIAAVIYATGSSSVNLNDSTVIEQAKSQTGNVIFCNMIKIINTDNVYFKNNSQIDIYLDKSTANLTRTLFEFSEQQSIYAVSSSLTMFNTTFQNSSNGNVYGKGLYCSCRFVNLTNCTFQNLSGVIGGAIYLASDYANATFYLQNNTFRQNSAQQGGALFINDAAYLKLTRNTFLYNKALVINPQTAESSKYGSKALGGGMYYACNNDGFKKRGQQCRVILSQFNLFDTNYAQNDGGAIQYVSTRYEDDSSTRFRNNSAFYARNIGSYPKSLFVEFTTNGDYLNRYDLNHTLLDEGFPQAHRQLQAFNKVPELVPGVPFSFNIYLLDQDGQLYNTDNSSKAVFKQRGNDRVYIGNNEVFIKDGTYFFKDVEVDVQPGLQVNFQLDLIGVTTYGNNITFLDAPINFKTQFRKCVPGETQTGENQCLACPEGYYQYESPNEPVACKKCQKNTQCYGKAQVAPDSGYWRSNSSSENIMECPNSAVCLGGNETYPTGRCDEGYTGVLCGECIHGFHLSKEFTCKLCPEKTKNIITISFLMTFGVAYSAYMVRSTLLGADEEQPVSAVYMKIITDHFQVLGAISTIDFQWPSQISQIWSTQEDVSKLTQSFFSFDCLLMDSQSSVPIIPLYYQKLLIYAFLPILLAIIDLVFWLIYRKFRLVSDMRSSFTSTLVVCLFLVHPDIAENMLQVYNCMQVDDDFRLQNNLSSVCYQGEHLFYMLTVALPSTLLWTIGIPLFAVLLLVANRKSLLLFDKQTITKDEQKMIKTVKTRYGFLLGGYKADKYYWETIIMYRKLFIVMSAVFLSTMSKEIQVLVVMFIVIMSLCAQTLYQPYYSVLLNKMETYSLMVGLISLYAGMFFVTGQHYDYMQNEAVTWFFLVVVFFPNVIFITWWASFMRIEVLKDIYEKNKPKLFKLVACMTMEQFYEKYLKNVETNEKIILSTETPEQIVDHEDIELEMKEENEEKGILNRKKTKLRSERYLPNGESGNHGDNEDEEAIKFTETIAEQKVYPETYLTARGIGIEGEQLFDKDLESKRSLVQPERGKQAIKPRNSNTSDFHEISHSIKSETSSNGRKTYSFRRATQRISDQIRKTKDEKLKKHSNKVKNHSNSSQSPSLPKDNAGRFSNSLNMDEESTLHMNRTVKPTSIKNLEDQEIN